MTHTCVSNRVLLLKRSCDSVSCKFVVNLVFQRTCHSVLYVIDFDYCHYDALTDVHCQKICMMFCIFILYR